jgi:hypothetical protein
MFVVHVTQTFVERLSRIANTLIIQKIVSTCFTRTAIIQNLFADHKLTLSYAADGNAALCIGNTGTFASVEQKAVSVTLNGWNNNIKIFLLITIFIRNSI